MNESVVKRLREVYDNGLGDEAADIIEDNRVYIEALQLSLCGLLESGRARVRFKKLWADRIRYAKALLKGHAA